MPKVRMTEFIDKLINESGSGGLRRDTCDGLNILTNLDLKTTFLLRYIRYNIMEMRFVLRVVADFTVNRMDNFL